MRPFTGISIQRYKNSDMMKGVLHDNLFRINSFITFNTSNPNKDASVVLSNKGSYWESDGESNPFFGIIFNSHLFRLQSISLVSCHVDRCFKDVNVFGSNEGEVWEPICEIRETYESFLKNAKNVECKTNFLYKRFKIVHHITAKTYMPLHYLELFGDLYSINSSRYSQKCLRSKYDNHYLIILIMISK